MQGAEDDLVKTIVRSLPRKAGADARPYHVHVEDVESAPNTWKTAIVHIFRGETKIGSYDRNYPGFGEATFEPFELDGKWFALYSPDYTCTRVMALPECRDIGGEEPHGTGFCPMDLFVPRYRKVVSTYHSDGAPNEVCDFESQAEVHKNLTDEKKTVAVAPWQCLDIAFVAGCIWGDDSSKKLQVFDLSKASEGILTGRERCAHAEIALGLPLAAAVQLSKWDEQPFRCTLLREEARDIVTGK